MERKVATGHRGPARRWPGAGAGRATRRAGVVSVASIRRTLSARTHRSFPMPEADAPKAPPTERDEEADPSDPSDQAESNGWSRRKTSSHRCGSSGRPVEPMRRPESLSSSGSVKSVAAAVRSCCGSAVRFSWGLPRRSAGLPSSVARRCHSHDPLALLTCPFLRQIRRRWLTHHAPMGRDERVGGNQQAFGEFRRAKASTVRRPFDGGLASMTESRSSRVCRALDAHGPQHEQQRR